MNREESKKIQEILNEKGQEPVDKIVKKEKNRISKIKEKVNSKKQTTVKEYLIDSPNPNQKNIDKIIEKEKEKQHDEQER